MVYDLLLEEEKVKPQQVTALHLICAFAFIGAGAIIFRYNFVITMWGLALLIAGIMLLGVILFKNKWVISKKTNPVLRIAELLVALWIAVYSLMQQWKFPVGIFGVLSAAILFALYWERSANKSQSIYIDDEGVKLPVTSRRRFIPWTGIEQVVLRFGTLSIDCVDNRLFQWNIANPEFDNEIFEAYCLAKVEENRSKRRNEEEW